MYLMKKHQVFFWLVVRIEKGVIVQDLARRTWKRVSGNLVKYLILTAFEFPIC